MKRADAAAAPVFQLLFQCTDWGNWVREYKASLDLRGLASCSAAGSHTTACTWRWASSWHSITSARDVNVSPVSDIKEWIQGEEHLTVCWPERQKTGDDEGEKRKICFTAGKGKNDGWQNNSQVWTDLSRAFIFLFFLTAFRVQSICDAVSRFCLGGLDDEAPQRDTHQLKLLLSLVRFAVCIPVSVCVCVLRRGSKESGSISDRDKNWLRNVD